MGTLEALQADSAALEPALVQLEERYRKIRQFSETLCETLEPEDCCIQSMPDASPARWHLAHTAWFFETFVLDKAPESKPARDSYRYLFNSYYNAIGEQFPRAQRGLLSRPTVAQVLGYRHEVDLRMLQLFQCGAKLPADFVRNVELGLNHEQQHQELILTDIKHAFSRNPLLPAYRSGVFPAAGVPPGESWTAFSGGIFSIGHHGHSFAFDNEAPRHRVLLEDYELCNRLVASGEFMKFIDDGGYRRPELWLSEGWQHVSQAGWQAPLYWTLRDGAWHEFTLAGLQRIDPRWPVCHVSYFEADAYARWAGARLPTEAEWETASHQVPFEGEGAEGGFADSLLASGMAIHPTHSGASASASGQPAQMFGCVWQWTSSSYAAYPGYAPAPGALGEYNGKFMCNQYVLRGGSCATPSGHIRPTYRNFFPASARWQFSGIRLARQPQPLDPAGDHAD